MEYNDPMKFRILTIAPESWSIRKISRELFGTTKYLAGKAKELRSTRGVLTKVIAKSGKTLSDSTTTKVDEFYNDDSISRLLPGVKDTVSVNSVTVKVNDNRVKMQKRFIDAS